MDSTKFFLETKILCLQKQEKKRKPKATKANLKDRAVNGSLQSIIGLVVIKADDQSRIKIKGKSFIIKKKNYF